MPTMPNESAEPVASARAIPLTRKHVGRTGHKERTGWMTFPASIFTKPSAARL